MPKVDVDRGDLENLMEWVTTNVPNIEVAFSMLLIAASSIGRDVGGLDKETFIKNCMSAWNVAPHDIVVASNVPMPEGKPN